MKIFKRVILAVVVLVVLAAAVVYFKLNTIVRSVVETQATNSLNVPTTLGSANLNLFGGNVSLKNLDIGSPVGFSAPKMFSLGGVAVDTSLSELRQTPLKVSQIVIDNPRLVLEQKGMKTNVQALMDQLPKSQPQPDASGKPSEPMKLIIGLLQMNNAELAIKSDTFDKEFTLKLPSVTVKDIGSGEGNKNGAAVKEVIAKAMQGIIAAASESDQLPAPVKLMLKGNLNELASKLGGEVKAQAEKIQQDLTNKATGEMNKLLGKNDGKTPSTQDVKGNAVEGLKDLLGGDKKK